MNINFSNVTVPARSIIKIDNNHKFKTALLNELVKNHLFLVVEEYTETIEICPISSQIIKAQENDANIIISEWEAAGLDKESYVGTDTVGVLDKQFVYSVLPKKLQTTDFSKVLEKINGGNIRQKLESKIYNTGYPEYLDYQLDSNGSKHFVLFD